MYDKVDGEDRVAAGQLRRQIPDDYKYNAKKVKSLKRILHNVSVALGTMSSALNEFSRLKGPEVSPDGMLGGTGYIIPIQDIKQTLITSVHGLSNVADCIADELTNPKWKAHDDEEVKELIKEKDEATEKIEEQTGIVDDEISPDDVTTPKDVVTVPDMETHVDEKKHMREASDRVGRLVSGAVRRRLIELSTT